MSHSITTVWTTLAVPGFHSWPDAPNVVHHLRKRHRHLFHLKVELSVEDYDREVEFQLLKSQLATWLPQTFEVKDDALKALEFGYMSCESIARVILMWLQKEYPDRRYYEVGVSEDGESGAIVMSEG